MQSMVEAKDTRILVVDDEKGLLELLHEHLGHFGYHQVETFIRPEDALDAFREDPNSYGVAFLNWQMPSMDGITLARRLREISGDLFVILYTGADVHYAKQQDPYRVIDLYLQRPTPLRRLDQVMQEVTKLISRPPTSSQ